MPVEVHAPEQHHFAAGAEIACLQVAAVKPLGVNEAAAVGENDVEYPAASPRLDDAASIHAGVHGGLLADPQR